MAGRIKEDSAEAFVLGYQVTGKTKKWGIIDSTGKIIVPFICDGAKAVSENEGIISVFSTSSSLNTGIPIYRYIGKYYHFTKEGKINGTEKVFSLTIELSDFHNTEFVIPMGPEFYLPSEFRKVER